MALLTFQAFDQRRFFTTNIGTSAPMEIQVEVISGAAGILADQSSVIGFRDGRIDDFRFVVEFAADVAAVGVAEAG